MIFSGSVFGLSAHDLAECNVYNSRFKNLYVGYLQPIINIKSKDTFSNSEAFVPLPIAILVNKNSFRFANERPSVVVYSKKTLFKYNS